MLSVNAYKASNTNANNAGLNVETKMLLVSNVGAGTWLFLQFFSYVCDT